MADDDVNAMWQRVRRWFVADAEHSTVAFLPQPGAQPLTARAGYVRLWLTEGFLARSRAMGMSRFPVLHGGVRLSFLGNSPTAFSGLTKTPQDLAVPGAQMDFPLTALLPFNGGTVEVEAALYSATSEGPVGVAVNLLDGLGALLGPPLATAAAIVDKVSGGLDSVLSGNGTDPVLAVHWTLLSQGGGGSALMPGYLVVVRTPQRALGGRLVMINGCLHLENGRTHSPLTGHDYLVLRVECREERDDWRLPELDELIRSAGTAFILGRQEVYQAQRTEAIARAWNCADLVPPDRKRVALLVKEELDLLAELGATPGPERTLGSVAPFRLAAPDDSRLDGLTLGQLLS